MKSCLTKRRIALIQLEQSLRLLQAGDPVSALTLPGAAEEILGRVASKKGYPPCVELTADGIASLFDRARKLRPRKEHLINFLNYARNHLKHQDDGRNMRVDLDWQGEAENMIFRAMLNHLNAFQCYPANKALRSWMTHIMPR